MKVIKNTLYMLILIFLTACGGGSGGGKASTSTPTLTPAENKDCSESASTSLNAIVAENIIPKNIDVFDRYINFGGLSLFVKPNNSDDFLINVAKTYRDMLGGDLGYTSDCVDTLNREFTSFNVAQRIWSETKPEEFEVFGNSYEAVDLIEERASFSSQEQINEVIEHLLHTISVLGLSQVFPNKWDYTNKTSSLYLSMQQAIDGGYYDITSYENHKASDPAQHQKIIQQEFAYAAILTAWGLKPQVWPESEGEWTLSTAIDVKEKLPLFWTLYENTIENFLTAPLYTDLEARFP